MADESRAPKDPLTPGKSGEEGEARSLDRLLDALARAPHQFDFFQALRRIEVLQASRGQQPRLGAALRNLFTVSDIWAMDDALTRQLAPWPTFRRVRGHQGEIGNFANHCNAISGIAAMAVITSIWSCPAAPANLTFQSSTPFAS